MVKLGKLETIKVIYMHSEFMDRIHIQWKMTYYFNEHN